MNDPYAEENPFDQRHIYAPDKRLCPRCLGMRFLAFDVPVGDPRFSQITPCPRCSAGPHQPQGGNDGRE